MASTANHCQPLGQTVRSNSRWHSAASSAEAAHSPATALVGTAP